MAARQPAPARELALIFREGDGTVNEDAAASDEASVREAAPVGGDPRSEAAPLSADPTSEAAVLNAEATLSEATAASVHKDPETIRQEIEATKDRISDSVEALAEIKADMEYARSHPKEVVREKVVAAKDQIIARVVEKKEELAAHRRASSSSGGGPKEALTKAKGKIVGAYESLESKLDELLGVEVEKKPPED